MQAHPNVQGVPGAGHGGCARQRRSPVSGPHPARRCAHRRRGAERGGGGKIEPLVFDADGEPVLVLTSGAHRVDTDKVAAVIGARRVRQASPDFVREHTGQPIGGVAPGVASQTDRTLVDQALAEYDEIWAPAGPRAVFPPLRRTGAGDLWHPAEVA